MKTYHRIVLVATVLIGLMFAPSFLHAQEAAAPATSTAPAFNVPDAVQNAVLGFVLDMAKSHQWIATLISFMGLARVFGKPLGSLIHNFVELSPSKRDDGWLTSFLEFFNVNPVGRVLNYVVTWVLSIPIQVPNDPDAGKK